MKLPPAAKPTAQAVDAQVRATLASLKRRGSKRNRDGMARFGIISTKIFGVSLADLRQLARRAGRSHELAAALWDTGWHEARTLAAFVEDPARVTPRQMDQWCRTFDNWAICDTVCFDLFDRTPHAWRKIRVWSRRKDEFVRRAAFALLASVSVHDKKAGDERFLHGLRLVEQAADDGRNFVKKAVNWALRAIGKRNLALHAAAVEVAARLARSPDGTSRWVGKDALRELTSPSVLQRLERRRR
jgi:3-methyladenine DNA glycosylase AlkD